MKKFLRLALASLGIASVLTPIHAEVGDVWKSGDLWYRELTANTVAVVKVPAGEETVYTGAINISPNVNNNGVNFTVTHIADSAFRRTTIQSVTFPGSLMVIGKRAFASTMLEKVDFPMSPMLQTIEDGAFASNHYLESISFTNLCRPKFNPREVFAECEKLNEITVQNGNQLYSSYDGVLYDRAGKEILLFPPAKPTLEISPKCEEIPDSAFFESKLTSVKIPDSVKKIGKKAFMFCDDLKEVFTGDGVEILPEECFFGAGNGSLIVTLGKNVKTIEKCCFLMSDMNDVIWNEGLTVIGSEAFASSTLKHNSSNRELILPESVDSIGWKAFAGTMLTKVTIRPNVRYGTKVFNSCSDLRTVKIEEGVTELSAGLFMLCPFYNIYLPASLEKIGKNAFQQCTQLRKIEVAPESPYFTVYNHVLFTKDMTKLMLCPAQQQYMKHKIYTVPDGVKEIETAAFATNDFIEQIIFPASLDSICALSCGRMTVLQIADLSKTKIKAIPERVFDSSLALTKVLLPDCVEEIKEEAFNSCTKLAEFKFPRNLKIIGNNAFYQAFAFIPIELPEGLDSIGNKAFYQAAIDGHLVIPSSVTKWGKKSFMYSGGYQEVTVNTKIPVPTDAFNGVFGLKKINIGPDVPGLEDGTFYIAYPYESLEEINMAEGIKYMGQHNLPGVYEKITLPNSLEEIGFFNFRNDNLRTIIFGTGLKSIQYLGTTPQLENLVCLATEPPTVVYDEDNYDEYKNIVTEYLYPLATLYVPDESVEKYQKADIWKKFSVIAPYSAYLDKVSGVTEVAGEVEETIIIEGRTIIPSGFEGMMSVTDLSGKVIYNGVVTSFTLPDSGVYLVNVNGQRKKIAVR